MITENNFQIIRNDRAHCRAIEIYRVPCDPYSRVASVLEGLKAIGGCTVSIDFKSMQYAEEVERFIEGLELALEVARNFTKYIEGDTNGIASGTQSN